MKLPHFSHLHQVEVQHMTSEMHLTLLNEIRQEKPTKELDRKKCNF